MSRSFPRNFGAVVGRIMMGLTLLVLLAAAGITYYVTPKYTRVGYTPAQPVAYSHQMHAGTLGIDCRFCHTHVDQSPQANIPTVQVCMNCHQQTRGNIKATSAQLTPLMEAFKNDRPVEWVKVHKLPDFVYFNHGVHVKRGVGCVTCHGRIDQMAVVRHEQPLSMSWCLDCHRDPGPNLRPAERVTEMQPLVAVQVEFTRTVQKSSGINPPVNCSGCHR